MVYVLSMSGEPLMPTERHGKVRRLLKDKKAKVVSRKPFTIRLLYETTNETQPVDLGVDAGSKTIGLSACTEKKELYAAEVELRRDVTNLLSTRREFRRARRNRKRRYRKPRFDNRVRSKNKGWLAPSVENKISAHEKAIADVMKILPITHVIVEVASFDLQKIKAIESGEPIPEGTDYQHGEQFGFWNVREYVLFKDGHKCMLCKGRSKDPILNVHHLESRKTGSDSPRNLITLCETCHKAYHAGLLKLPDSAKRPKPLRDAAFMGVMRKTLLKRLKEKYGDSFVSETYGYLTKNARIENGLEKTHAVDARCASGRPTAKPLDHVYFQKKVRRHNRSLHRAKILKGGIRKSNQAPKEVFGFRLFDEVRFEGTDCFVFARRSSGYFDLRKLDGAKVHASANHRKLKLLSRAKTTLMERRKRG